MVEIFRRTQNIIVSCYVLLVVHIEALGSNEDFPHYPKLKLSSVNYKKQNGSKVSFNSDKKISEYHNEDDQCYLEAFLQEVSVNINMPFSYTDITFSNFVEVPGYSH